MDRREQNEERNKRIGWLTSVSIQLLLFVIFYFIVAWKEPFPPIPEYGIELGFTSSLGGELASTNASENTREETPEEQPSENEDIQDDSTLDQVNEQQEQENNIEEIQDPDPARLETIDSEHVDQPIQEPDVETEVNESTTVESDQKETASLEKSQEIVDQRAVMDSNTADDSTGKDDNGDSEVDNRAIYGNQGQQNGNSEGASLSLAGWTWDFKPNPEDTSDQSGKIEYKIVVDQDGYLVRIETITSTVSPAVERVYKKAVEELTFSKTNDNITAPLSTGTITFIIKTK